MHESCNFQQRVVEGKMFQKTGKYSEYCTMKDRNTSQNHAGHHRKSHKELNYSLAMIVA